MRSPIIFLLISVALNAAFARNLVKRNCNYNDCGSSCSTPCNRPSNCNDNNNYNYNRSPCNNNIVDEESGSVPVLIPFPPTSNATFPKPPAEPTTNNTNINDNTVDINIQNTIDNINNISVPISLNSTNENTVIIHFEKIPAGNPADENQPTVAPSAVDCCLVVTPRKCDGNEEYCKEKREWICSEVCKGTTIIADPEPPAQLTVKYANYTLPKQLTAVPLCKLANGTSIACPTQAPDPEQQVPYYLTVEYATIPNQLTAVPLCNLANGTSVACPTQAPVYPIPQQVIYQPAPQPRYYIPWRPIQRNITTRPIQQVYQVPIQPIYTQQRPVYTLPSTPIVSTQPVYSQSRVQYVQQPVQQPVQTVQQVPRYVVVPQSVPQLIPRMNQEQYLRQYQGNVGAGFWGAYQRPYQTPCSSQGPWQSPCGSSAFQY